MLYQIWLQSNAKIFGGKDTLPYHVAKNVILYVASRLEDDRKSSLKV